MNIHNSAKKHYFPLRYSVLLVILTAFIPLFLVILGRDFNSEKTSMDTNYKAFQKQMEKDVVTAVRLLDGGFILLENALEEKMSKHLDLLLEAYRNSGGGPERMDLDGLKRRMGKDIEIYISDDEEVIRYSTSHKDVGMDFHAWRLDKFINHVRNSDGKHYSRMDPAFMTGELKKFGYVASPDHRYVLEIGTNAEKFLRGSGNQNMVSVLENMVKNNIYVDDIRLYNREGFDIGHPDKKPDPEKRRLFARLQKTGRAYTRKSGGSLIRVLFLNLNKPQYGLDPSLIVRIAYNQAYVDNALRKEAASHIVVGLLVIAAGVVLALFISARIAGPIHRIVGDVEIIGDIVKCCGFEGKSISTFVQHQAASFSIPSMKTTPPNSLRISA